MNISYFIFLGLFVVCLAVRTTYELLKEAGTINPKSKPLFASIFLTMCLLWVSWFCMCPLDPLKLALPEMAGFFGFFLFVLGWLLALGALVQLRGLENIDRLITTGLFSLVRHPMYTGFILWILGWSLYHAAAGSFIAGLVGIVNILYWRHLEDTRLESTYGDEYRQYRRRTRF